MKEDDGGRRKMKRNAKGLPGVAANRTGGDAHGKKKTKKNKERHSGRRSEAKDRKFDTNPDVLSSHLAKRPPALRKKVDPETAKYFSEIANLFESNSIDLEERPSVCANALEEARGKELELATDMVISRMLQTLLEGCELDQVCSFLYGCSEDFSFISMDRCGSHVVETALKALYLHLQDTEALAFIEDVLTKICKVVAADPVNIMCNCYGSHVVRSLLCLCKGLPLDSLEEFHSTKTTGVLAGRLNIQLPHHSRDRLHENHPPFLHLLKQFILEMLQNAGTEIEAVRVNKYGSFVLQVALKSLVGNDTELTNAILFLLGCSKGIISESLSLKSGNTQAILGLLEDTAASHLVEISWQFEMLNQLKILHGSCGVILEVAPADLYEEILQKIFRGSIYEMSSHQCGNFVVQALISSSRSKDQLDMIWEEIGLRTKELLEIGKAGVVASLLAACNRLECHGQEFCKVLARAVHSENEYSSSVVPRLLFLDSFLCCRDKSTWEWPLDNRMHVLGCLMLQTIFKFPNQFMLQYTKSFISLDANQIFKIAEDAGGSRVLESFLCSDASAKVKSKVISRLQGHFGELSLRPSGSFTVEKCFAASNLSFKEMIVIELSAVKDELVKAKHGPHVLKNLDIDGFMRRPEQWKSSQAAKETVYREFQATFGSQQEGRKALVSSSFDSGSEGKTRKKGHKRPRSQDEPGTLLPAGTNFPGLELSMAKLGFSNFKPNAKQARKEGKSGTTSKYQKKFVRNPVAENCFVSRGKKRKPSSELAELAGKRNLSSQDVRKLFDSSSGNRKKQCS